MKVAMSVAMILWTVGIEAICIASWREVVTQRGFEPHDTLLLIAGIGAPLGTLAWILFGVSQ